MRRHSGLEHEGTSQERHGCQTQTQRDETTPQRMGGEGAIGSLAQRLLIAQTGLVVLARALQGEPLAQRVGAGHAFGARGTSAPGHTVVDQGLRRGARRLGSRSISGLETRVVATARTTAIPNWGAACAVEAASSRFLTRQDGASSHHRADTEALENEIWNGREDKSQGLVARAMRPGEPSSNLGPCTGDEGRASRARSLLGPWRETACPRPPGRVGRGCAMRRRDRQDPCKTRCDGAYSSMRRSPVRD